MRGTVPKLFRLFLFSTAFLSTVYSSQGFTQVEQSNKAGNIGYPTVNAALTGLRSQPGITFREKRRWIIATDNSTRTIWAFTYESHPAHPAAVKRQIVVGDGGIFYNMNVLCEAQKTPCDKLVADFQTLNEKMNLKFQPKLKN